MDYYIKGKFRKVLYHNESNNYVVTLFKMLKTNDHLMEKHLNKVINATGIIPNLKLDVTYTLRGKYIQHPKYSWQYAFDSYEVEKPTTKEAIIEFLSSPFIEGCGDATAKKIVDLYGESSLEKIKEGKENLLVIKGMTEAKAEKIFVSVVNY